MDIQALLITPIKERIWQAAGKDLAIVKAAMGKAGTNDNSEKYWNKVLRIIKPVKKQTKITPEQYQRYRDAKYTYESAEFKHWIKDGHFIEPDTPDTGTANGLTRFIENFLNWSGHNAARINVQGQHVTEKYKGRVVSHGYRKTSTRRGQADISSTIHGKSVKFEIKAGNDRPSPAQLKEQQRERRAGGEYFFTHDVEEFFRQYDGLSTQNTIFE